MNATFPANASRRPGARYPEARDSEAGHPAGPGLGQLCHAMKQTHAMVVITNLSGNI